MSAAYRVTVLDQNLVLLVVRLLCPCRYSWCFQKEWQIKNRLAVNRALHHLQKGGMKLSDDLRRSLHGRVRRCRRFDLGMSRGSDQTQQRAGQGQSQGEVAHAPPSVGRPGRIGVGERLRMQRHSLGGGRVQDRGWGSASIVGIPVWLEVIECFSPGLAVLRKESLAGCGPAHPPRGVTTL